MALPNSDLQLGELLAGGDAELGAGLDDPQARDLQRQVLAVGELDQLVERGSLNARHQLASAAASVDRCGFPAARHLFASASGWPRRWGPARARGGRQGQRCQTGLATVSP